MLIILFRTLLMYLSLTLIMRLMGKRQLGELEITDLVTTLLISEIASLPLTDEKIPFLNALLPILTLAALEVGMAALLLRRPLFKRLLISRPTLLLSHGIPDRAAMKRARLSCEELLSQLRLQGVPDPMAVEYALMEPNGQISVIEKDQKPNLPAPKGLLRLLISDGRVSRENLTLTGKDEAWLASYLKKKGLRPRDVFMLLYDGGEVIRLYPMDPPRKA